MRVPRLINNDENGNEIAKKWREIMRSNPDDASLIRKAVDKGKERSIEYYVGFNQALIKIGSMFPDLPSGDSKESIVYQMMFVYTEYQMRNT